MYWFAAMRGIIQMKKLYITVLLIVAILTTARVLQPSDISASALPPSPAVTSQVADVTDAVYYVISIYYGPDRESDAGKVKGKLEELGYTVNRIPASTELQKKTKGHPSYIYFKDNDFDVMIRLRRELAALLGEEFNVFRSGPERADKDMRVFLAGKP